MSLAPRGSPQAMAAVAVSRVLPLDEILSILKGVKPAQFEPPHVSGLLGGVSVEPGSLERFLALYIEHTRGDFPLWLAPVQVGVLPIADRHHGYAGKVGSTLREAGVRVAIDERAEKLGFKIREAELQKIPVMLVLGDQEAEAGTVNPRWRRARSAKSEPVAVDAFVTDLVGRVARREA